MGFYGLWVFFLILLFIVLPSGKSAAEHKVGHCRPPPADAAFPSDFPILQDQEWGYRLGGWGGLARGHSVRHHPVIFIHGNTGDADDWDEPGRSVRRRFLEAGYSPQELWALSYNGKATKESPPALQCRTDNETNIPDLAAFVKAVQAYTGATKLDLVAHSLGVTVARAMLFTVCRRLWLIWVIGWKDFIGCDELVPGSLWLQKLNGPHGEREAPGPTRFLTIYDGTGTDIFFSPWLFFYPVGDQDSPALKGAKNVKIPGLTHDELRTNDEAISAYLRFVQQ
jgi:hypothetical protein